METHFKPSSEAAERTYAEIIVHDGDRVLKPTHVCSDEITFRDTPALASAEITISIRNGDRQTTRTARVLPHGPESTRIPIQLLAIEQKAPAKRIA
jgi:hypothetical protein